MYKSLSEYYNQKSSASAADLKKQEALIYPHNHKITFIDVNETLQKAIKRKRWNIIEYFIDNHSKLVSTESALLAVALATEFNNLPLLEKIVSKQNLTYSKDSKNSLRNKADGYKNNPLITSIKEGTHPICTYLIDQAKIYPEILDEAFTLATQIHEWWFSRKRLVESDMQSNRRMIIINFLLNYHFRQEYFLIALEKKNLHVAHIIFNAHPELKFSINHIDTFLKNWWFLSSESLNMFKTIVKQADTTQKELYELAVKYEGKLRDIVATYHDYKLFSNYDFKDAETLQRDKITGSILRTLLNAAVNFSLTFYKETFKQIKYPDQDKYLTLENEYSPVYFEAASFILLLVTLYTEPNTFNFTKDEKHNLNREGDSFTVKLLNTIIKILSAKQYKSQHFLNFIQPYIGKLNLKKVNELAKAGNQPANFLLGIYYHFRNEPEKMKQFYNSAPLFFALIYEDNAKEEYLKIQEKFKRETQFKQTQLEKKNKHNTSTIISSPITPDAPPLESKEDKHIMDNNKIYSSATELVSPVTSDDRPPPFAPIYHPQASAPDQSKMPPSNNSPIIPDAPSLASIDQAPTLASQEIYAALAPSTPENNKDNKDNKIPELSLNIPSQSEGEQENETDYTSLPESKVDQMYSAVTSSSSKSLDISHSAEDAPSEEGMPPADDSNNVEPGASPISNAHQSSPNTITSLENTTSSNQTTLIDNKEKEGYSSFGDFKDSPNSSILSGNHNVLFSSTSPSSNIYSSNAQIQLFKAMLESTLMPWENNEALRIKTRADAFSNLSNLSFDLRFQQEISEIFANFFNKLQNQTTYAATPRNRG